MGKLVENTVIIYILDELKNKKLIKVKIQRTDKNEAFIKIFEQYDFIFKETVYHHLINDNIYNKPEWF